MNIPGLAHVYPGPGKTVITPCGPVWFAENFSIDSSSVIGHSVRVQHTYHFTASQHSNHWKITTITNLTKQSAEDVSSSTPSGLWGQQRVEEHVSIMIKVVGCHPTDTGV